MRELKDKSLNLKRKVRIEMNQIKYVDNSEGYFYGENQKKWNPERDYGKEYINVYFRIEAKHYQYPFEGYDGYEEDQAAFQQEVRQMFQTLGWSIIPAKRERACDEAKNESSTLYLHPQHFSGVILKNDVKKIAEALAQAQTFKLCWVDLYQTYYEMTDEEYNHYLTTKQEEVKEAVFKACKTTRRNKFKNTLPIARELAKIIGLNRVGKDDYCADVNQTEGYIYDVMSQMVKEGYLVPLEKNKVNYVRSINKTEQKALKLALL